MISKKGSMKKAAAVLCLMAAVSSAFVYKTAAAVSIETKIMQQYGVRGDLNGDNKLNIMDLIRYQKIVTENKSVEADYITDINNDGVISSGDVVMLTKVLMKAEKFWTPFNMPVIESSEYVRELETGFKSAMLGLPYEDASKCVKKSYTGSSVQRILNKSSDLLFTTELPEDEISEAEKSGKKFSIIPAAKEGIVFAVGIDNPVESLTQEQIRDIYSGKITNWSEVGGKDAKIITYHRTAGSAERNHMDELMNGSEYADTMLLMNGVADTAAVNGTVSDMIVYSPAAHLMKNNGTVKFIAVDGVNPGSDEENKYPLLKNVSIVFLKGVSHNAEDFAEWALSDKGAECMKKSGYLPVGADISSDSVSVVWGTGKEKPDDFKVAEKSSVLSKYYSDSDVNGVRNFSLGILKDKVFEEQINNEIRAVLASENYSASSISVNALNGYMTVSVMYSDNRRQKFFNYDLKEKKKIERLSDLFYKDADMLSIINEGIQRCYEDNKYFSGISAIPEEFSIMSVYIDGSSPDSEFSFYRAYRLPEYMHIFEYYDMSDLFTEETASVTDEVIAEWDTDYVKYPDGEYYQTVIGSMYHSAAEVAERREAYRKVYEFGLERKQQLGLKEFQMSGADDDYAVNLDVINLFIDNQDNNEYMFDPHTGERIAFSDIFGKEFSYVDRALSVIRKIDPDKCTVNVIYKDDSEEEIKFNKENVAWKYILFPKASLKIYTLENPVSAVADDYYTEILDEDYVTGALMNLRYYEVKVMEDTDRRVVVKRVCSSYYECEKINGEYIGWIPDYDIFFKGAETDLQKKIADNYVELTNKYDRDYNNYYSLFDLDSDGKTELIINYEDDDYNTHIIIYSHDDEGNVHMSAEFTEEGYIQFYAEPDTENIMIFNYYGRTLERLIFRDGNFVKELICDENSDEYMYDTSVLVNAPFWCDMEYRNDIYRYFSNPYIRESEWNYETNSKTDIAVYDRSYIEGKAEKKICGTVSSGIPVKSERCCSSQGRSWFDCRNSDTGEYIGWIDAAYLVTVYY